MESQQKSPLTLADIRSAAQRIAPYVVHTPLLREAIMDELLGCQVYLKPEMLQLTGSFKIRGALSKVLSLTKEELAKGIIFSSSGNHAAACAYAGKLLGFRSIAVMPEDTPEAKVANCKKLGGDVLLWDRDYKKRIVKVRQEVAERGYTLVHGFEDYTVMAGQGTIALEILEDEPEIETVVVPIGGGGLISGISTAIKESNPKVRVVGVQAAASCAFYLSRINGRPTDMNSQATVADGINSTYIGNNPYPIIEKNVDEIVIVDEPSIKESVVLLGRCAKLVAEPTSAVVVAALLSGKIRVRPDEKVCCVLTSGNYDIDLMGRFFKGEEVEGTIG